MTEFENRGKQQINATIWGVCGGLLAVALALALSYILTHLGIGSYGTGSGSKSLFSQSALNLYAVSHIGLTGSFWASAHSAQNLNAVITLPLTVWAVIPCISLLLGGRIAARKLEVDQHRLIIGAGLVCALTYVFVLAWMSKFVHGYLDPSLLPEFDGISINPPAIPFYPALDSIVTIGLLWALVFSVTGALITGRRPKQQQAPWRLASYVKAVLIPTATLFLLTSIGAGWYVSRMHTEGGSHFRMLEMIPVAWCLSYELCFGSTVTGRVDVNVTNSELSQTPLSLSANILDGIARNDDNSKSKTPLSYGVIAAVVVIAAIFAFFAGWLVVRFGVNDGPLLASLELGITHVVLLILISSVCGLALKRTDAFSTSTVFLGVHFGPANALFVLIFAVFAYLGAMLSSKNRTTIC